MNYTTQFCCELLLPFLQNIIQKNIWLDMNQDVLGCNTEDTQTSTRKAQTNTVKCVAVCFPPKRENKNNKCKYCNKLATKKHIDTTNYVRDVCDYHFDELEAEYTNLDSCHPIILARELEKFSNAELRKELED